VTVPTLLVDDDDAHVGRGADTRSGDGPAATAGPRRRLLGALPPVAAVLLPLALFLYRALHAPLNFDGGMNMQVAQRLAQGEGYSRFYDTVEVFPHEVQTNGPFIYLAAAAIKVFGSNQFAFQLANLLFVAAFAAAVYWMLRDRPVLRVVGPALVLLVAPSVALYALGGLGEIPVSFFLLLTVLALVEGVRTPERAPWWVLGAGLSFGAAVTTKTFATGALPALALGGLCVLVAAPTRRLRLQVVAAGAAVAVLPIVRELHKLAATGGLSEYRAWWDSERSSISKQTGFEGGARSVGPIRRFLDHMHVLSGHVDFPAELLLVVLFLPMVWAAAVLLWRWRTRGLEATLSDPASALLLVMASLAAAYVLWWMLFVPEAKLWIRRIYPGMLAVQLLYLLMLPWLLEVGRSALARARGTGTGTGDPADEASAAAKGRITLPPALLRWGPAVGLAATVVLVAATALPYTARKLDGNTRSLVEVKGQDAWLHANQDAADYIEDHPDDRFYGDEWWSAPVISVMADTPFHNLGDSDFCSLDPDRDRLVWDLDAHNIRSPEPWTRDDALAYEEVAAYGGYVTIYSVAPGPAADCDAGD
jgi:4-amino-4-deoxy-L-arabinose transferase-like glycosyltransferase